MTAGTDTGTFRVFGTTAVLLVTEPGSLTAARAIADSELAAVDQACSRFRPDSELSILNAADGAPTQASELFCDLIEAALRAARLTAGAVDPTCGLALAAIGYDRDFAEIQEAAGRPGGPAGAPGLVPGPGRVPGWQSVRLDRGRRLVQLADGAQLDLGATAKAWAADRCAQLICADAGCGVLVSLGGDIAVAGPAPAGGWQIRVTDDHAAGPEAPGQTVSVSSGGLATSSTTVRSWASDGQRMHHIIDPSTGQPADSCWRTVSVAAGNCVDANTASTAAIIRGEAALPWLRDAGLPARLVAHDGTVETTAGWPSPVAPSREATVKLAIVVTSSTPLWYLTRATGLVALVLLTASMALGLLSSVRYQRPAWPRFVTAGLHRNTSLLALVFTAIHIVTTLADSYVPIRVQDVVIPFISAYRPLWLGLGTVAFDLMLALTVTSLLRTRMSYPAWRLVHWWSYLCWPVAVLHGLGTGTDTPVRWVLVVTVICVAVIAGLTAWRLAYGWPSHAAVRVAGAVALVLALVAGGIWLNAGPLQPGWARRSGTPATLIRGKSGSAPAAGGGSG